MSKQSNKKSASLLAAICKKNGISDVIISPGSRNAPLIITFGEDHFFNCKSISDERSAAFFGLGLALKKQRPVVLSCTSGSASLNYAPAIVEAYYQKIPLVIVTADRPSNLIDIGDGQTMRQEHVYANFIKWDCSLLCDPTSEQDIEVNEMLIHEAIYQAQSGRPGPVHINIPFDEPLYNTEPLEDIELKDPIFEGVGASPIDWNNLSLRWNGVNKIMVIVGQMDLNPALSLELQKRSNNQEFVLLTENLSNQVIDGTIDQLDITLSGIDSLEGEELKPDLVITLGDAIVSKKIKSLLRLAKVSHWHVDSSGPWNDVFQSLEETIKVNPILFLQNMPQKSNPTYLSKWSTVQIRAQAAHRKYLSNCPWSDLKAFEILMEAMPTQTHIHLGNSSPVRYAQFFNRIDGCIYLSNRGVSGIDGSSSTAAGYASEDDGLNVLITGDVSFLYDSNALWNDYINSNLRIIVINNGGGNIFKMIPGPSSTEQLDEFFVTYQSHRIGGLAKAFGYDFKSAASIEALEEALPSFFKMDDLSAKILEVHTGEVDNGQIFQHYIRALKKTTEEE